VESSIGGDSLIDDPQGDRRTEPRLFGSKPFQSRARDSRYLLGLLGTYGRLPQIAPLHLEMHNLLAEGIRLRAQLGLGGTR
jgi:hypothetical protein